MLAIDPPAGIKPTPLRCRCKSLTNAPHYRSVVRALHRRRKGVGSISAEVAIVDEYFPMFSKSPKGVLLTYGYQTFAFFIIRLLVTKKAGQQQDYLPLHQDIGLH